MADKPDKAAKEESVKLQRKSWLDLNTATIEPNLLKLIPKEVASKYGLIPVYKNGEVLFIAMANPKDITAIDAVRARSQIHAIIPLFASKEEVQSAIDRHYGLQEKMRDILQEVKQEKLEETPIKTEEEKEASWQTMAEQAPIVKLVNHILMEAIQEQCSDIHVEPDEKVLRVRLRRDGLMRESHVFDRELESAIIARLKIMSGMDIAEKRKPQDGRIRYHLESKQVDIRVSSLPTLYGENIVMRLLDKTAVRQDLGQLGMEEPSLSGFKRAIKKPHGILLVTGPTGSGKSTTLYGGLNQINDIGKNIVTVEDPIEYDLQLIRQTQVNPKVGLTFASGLRSILRQDPDIIMVGEIRDSETAEIAVQAALTGHLVLSTLHTNDAAGAITRLEDMGIEPFLIANSVVGILAQRLVRIICEECKQEMNVPLKMREELNVAQEVKFYEGRGCDACHQKGYAGRTGIHEFLEITPEIQDMITLKAPQSDIQKQGIKQGMVQLRQSGLAKAKEGVTTLQEVMKVTG